MIRSSILRIRNQAGSGHGRRRLLLHPQMGRITAHSRPLLVAMLRGNRRCSLFLNVIDGNILYETWHRKILNFSAIHFIDRDCGGWHLQLDEHLKPNTIPFYGKPDIQPAVQACLIPLFSTTGSLTRGIISARHDGKIEANGYGSHNS